MLLLFTAIAERRISGFSDTLRSTPLGKSLAEEEDQVSDTLPISLQTGSYQSLSLVEGFAWRGEPFRCLSGYFLFCPAVPKA